MKKYILVIVAIVFVSSTTVFAQKEETDRQSTSSAEKQKLNLVLKSKPPASDKSELFDVVGVKRSVFTASNTADGTLESFNHSMRINLEITASNNHNYMLVFYSPGEEIPMVYSSSSAVPSIFYPISMYAAIKEKLDQSLASRKKIQLQIVEKTTGFREVSLIF